MKSKIDEKDGTDADGHLACALRHLFYLAHGIELEEHLCFFLTAGGAEVVSSLNMPTIVRMLGLFLARLPEDSLQAAGVAVNVSPVPPSESPDSLGKAN